MDQADLRKARDDLLDRVVAAPGVEEAITLDATRVSEQHLDRDVTEVGIARQLQFREVLGDRRLESHLAPVYQLHDQSGGVHLGDRPDLEHRVDRDWIASEGVA